MQNKKKMFGIGFLLLSMVFGLFTTNSVEAVQTQQKVLPSDPSAPGLGIFNDRFGYSVAIDGDYAVVGAPYDDVTRRGEVGSAYIFHKTASGWVEEDKLNPSDGNGGDHFGYSVAIDGDYAVVGAPFGADTGGPVGEVYIFHKTKNGWEEEQKIVSNDPENGGIGDLFGYSVAIDGNYIVASSPISNGFFSIPDGPGAAYVFYKAAHGWAKQAKLVATDISTYDWFGNSVDISGSDVIVGSPRDDHSGVQDAGSSYIFHRTSNIWSQQTKIIADDFESDDNFGSSVSLSGNYAVVGAPYEDFQGNNAGAVYILTKSVSPRGSVSWSQSKVYSSETTGNFGKSLSIEGDTFVVGAGSSSGSFSSAGSVYVFSRSFLGQWFQTDLITANDSASHDQFGFSVGVSGDTLISGSPYDDDNGDDSGSAYFDML